MQEIIQKGVMRSGNVLLRLILNHIFNENKINNYSYRFFSEELMPNNFISKTTGKKEPVIGYPSPAMHSYEKLKKNNILIIPWRDPYDNIISFIRTEWSKIPPDPMFPWKTPKFPTLNYIKQSCEKTAKYNKKRRY